MKTLKKHGGKALALLLAAVMVFSAAGCKKNAGGVSSVTGPDDYYQFIDEAASQKGDADSQDGANTDGNGQTNTENKPTPGIDGERSRELTLDFSKVRGINFSSPYAQSWSPEALSPSKYREDLTRQDLKNVADMGLNSIRLWPRTINYFTNDIADNIKANQAVYQSVLKICREYKLSVLLLVFMEVPEAYGNGSKAAAIMDMYAELAIEFKDIIIGIEVCNEPDINILPLDSAAPGKYKEASSDWQKRKPFLTWATEYMKKKNTGKLLSCGFISAPLYDSYDQTNFGVANIHNYEPTLSAFAKVIDKMKAEDKKHLGKERPIAVTEIGHQGGRMQPVSDITEYCEANGIGYYIWEYANGYWGDIQGVVDLAGAQRVSTFPFFMVRNFKTTYPVEAVGYDVTGPSNGLKGWADAIFGKINAFSAIEYDAESFINGVRCHLGYYTESHDRILARAPKEKGGLSKAKYQYHYGIYTAACAALPYIRDYGTYTTNNALGGTEKPAYWDGGDMPVPMHYRPKFQKKAGKDGSAGVLFQGENRLLSDRKLESGRYSVSADLKPGFDSNATIVVLATKDNKQIVTPAIRISVSAAVSAQGAKLPNMYPKAYTLSLSNATGETIATAQLSARDFDKNGYVYAEVKFDAGVKSSSIEVFINGTRKLQQAVQVEDTAAQVYAGFDGMVYQSMFVDNFVVKSADGKALFSDNFESVRRDFDRLVYNVGNNVQLKTLLGDIVSRERALLQMPEEGGSAPSNIKKTQGSGLMRVTFTDNFHGEAAYEVEALLDGQYAAIWRGWPDNTDLYIPQYEAKNQYRLTVIKKDGSRGPSVNF